ncbi:S8 family serine peptidase [Fictibacillus sp. Mic-4]|uniref:S8 family peptidase n=1 Tax=Fictibacillus sp. Mic-4 TaxID=3132826 RepID=UPI003CEC9E8F
MRKKRFKGIAALFLIIALCVSLIQPKVSFASGDSADETTELQKGQAVEGKFSEPGQIHWYKITPHKEDVFKDTHMRIKVSGDLGIVMSVYPDAERAKKDITFSKYRSMIDENNTSEVDLPYAWEGPYYIKVEYAGTGDEEENGAPGNSDQPSSASYSLKFDGVKLPPSEDLGDEGECPVELSAGKGKSGKALVDQLRIVRDGLLAKTEQGKKLTDLYYKMAPYIAVKMIVHKDAREAVYNNLVQLKPVFNELVKSGDKTDYVLTEKDAKAINELYGIVMDYAPESAKKEIQAIAEQVDIAHLKGKKLSAVLDQAGLVVKDYAQNRVIVKLKEGASISSLNKKAKSYNIQSTNITALHAKDEVAGNLYVMNVNNNSQMQAAKLDRLPEVEFAEPVYQYHQYSTDVQYDYQWALKNNGGFGKQGADIQYEKLQSLIHQRKLNETLIAVVDTGVDATLTDLKGKVDTNLGKNFIPRIPTNDANDDNGHGTHVAGIIAAESDNGYSMAGIHPKAKIMPVKVLDSSGSGGTDQIAMGIKYAVDHGAKVINLSLGGTPSRVIESMLKYAASKNVTVVAASGNEGTNMVGYPASSKYAIAVGATNQLDIVADFSNYGPQLDVVAPGASIPSLLPNGNVTYLDGTSMATPHVAAVAGLLLAENPKLTPGEVERILTLTTNDVAVDEVAQGDYEDGSPFKAPPGFDLASGWGRLNAFKAVSMVELNFKVNEIKDTDAFVTGSAKPGTLITVKSKSKTLGSAKAGADGHFKVAIKYQKANEVLHVFAQSPDQKAMTSAKIAVQKNQPPAKPKVNTVSDRDQTVTGKTVGNAVVKVRNAAKKVIATAKANSKGEFKVKIAKQKAGTTLYVTATDVWNREGQAAKVTVKDKTPPHAPKVNTVDDRDTTVTGKTEAKASVIVKYKGKTIGTKQADSKGMFKVAIKKQKAGSVLYVTAKDSAGNTSKATKTTVKKAKK